MKHFEELEQTTFTISTLESIKQFFKTTATAWLKHNINKNSKITNKSQEAKLFSELCGIEINRQTFSQYMNGERFNLEFYILFSQVSGIPLTRLLGPTVYDIEKRNIFKQANLKPINHISTNKAVASLPKEYAQSDFIKMIRLPNDVEQYRKDDFALVDVETREFISDGVYIVTEPSQPRTPQAKYLTHEPDGKIIGKVTNVLVKA